jgi:cation diffusion facilitator CzcD-associated flavoprotein CzcO
LERIAGTFSRVSDLRPELPVLIVGAGPAGLATAYELGRRSLAYRLFERGPTLGNSWVNAYDSLQLHTGRHMSTLPGPGYPAGTPLFPTREEFVNYLRDYTSRSSIRVETGRDVRALRREGDYWIAEVDEEEVKGSAVVMAAGIMSNPHAPAIPGHENFTGEIIHSVQYRRPDVYRDKRVLVIGAGNSGGEIASELGAGGAEVTVLVRQGANVVPRTIAGVPIQYLAAGMKRLPYGMRHAIASLMKRLSLIRAPEEVLPRPPWTPADKIPIIGFHLVEAIRAGRVKLKLGTVDRFERDGAVFNDGARQEFNSVILATGFAPALGPLGSLIRRDERGFAMRTDNVSSADQPGLWFVGMRYDTTGAIANIKEDAQVVGRRLASWTIERRLG